MTLFEPTETVSAVQATAGRLRASVLNGRLQPGEQVTEAEVAEDFGVSRPTAKSAITILVNDGVLRREANKPAYVPRLSPADVEDLFLARIPLELAIVRLVTARVGHVPAGAATAVREMETMPEDAPTSQFVQADLGFHLSLVESVASRHMTRMYRTIQGEIHLSMVQSQRVLGAVLIAKEHGEILDALRAGNNKEASTLMQGHLERARDKIVAKLHEAEATAGNNTAT
jgi:DNA-binding GntR family transcriptional regulator